MPSIEGRHDGRRIVTDVAVLAAENPADLSHVIGRALIDTGATSSGVGPTIVTQLGLRSYGKRPLGSATDERMMPYYFFRLGFLGYRDANGMIETHAFPYVIGECDGFGWPMARHFDVIIGMDVLGKCRFTVDRNFWSIEF
ncbi:hypothetical protein [Sphingopyxis sp. FD7]|uniref:hypothetical protein n=1 Tax=Sphingopyxis sp. FD7 TaxID=1914525 RepID=UPI000DC622C4|nr:hypothetical protein [Sphingopyxis sp. FD7]BBB13835.1 hypothetical protein SPYCA_3093 [Sphingopyxis sp. FD7]